MADQQRLINVLRPNVFHRLVGVRRRYVVLADHEPVFRRNRYLEVFAVADHVKSGRAHDRHQPHHVQRIRLPRQDVPTDFLIVGDVALFDATDRAVDVDRRLQRADRLGLLIDAVDQPLLRGLLERGFRVLVFHRTRAEHTAARGQHCDK